MCDVSIKTNSDRQAETEAEQQSHPSYIFSSNKMITDYRWMMTMSQN